MRTCGSQRPDPSSFRVGRKLFGAGHIGKRFATREDLWLEAPFRALRRAEVRDGDGTLSTDISGSCRRQAVPLISHPTCPRAKHETTSSGMRTALVTRICFRSEE